MLNCQRQGFIQSGFNKPSVSNKHHSLCAKDRKMIANMKQAGMRLLEAFDDASEETIAKIFEARFVAVGGELFDFLPPHLDIQKQSCRTRPRGHRRCAGRSSAPRNLCLPRRRERGDLF
jgi:hypothetical protein